MKSSWTCVDDRSMGVNDRYWSSFDMISTFPRKIFRALIDMLDAGTDSLSDRKNCVISAHRTIWRSASSRQIVFMNRTFDLYYYVTGTCSPDQKVTINLV